MSADRVETEISEVIPPAVVSAQPDPLRYRKAAPRLPAEGPVDLRQWAPPGDELEIEIGFGRGNFLFERAYAAPRAALLGIEVKTKFTFLVHERVTSEKLNVRVFANDAREIFSRALPAASVARIFVNFPDPWWKRRHAGRTVVGQGLLEHVVRLLRDGGEFFVQTDVEDRALQFVDAIRQCEALALKGDPFVADNPYNARSNRERRAISDGLPIYRILAHKR